MGKSRKTPRVLVVLGPTASGKTRLGVRLASLLGGEVVSADSRQVYRGLDIGSGKDLSEYESDGRPVPYHLIDIVDIGREFSVFDYQKAFYGVFDALCARGALPVVVGGTGLYLEAVLKGYRLVETPENPILRAELSELSQEALVERLKALGGPLHNTVHTSERGRLIRAIEIAAWSRDHTPEPAPPMDALLLGTLWDRAVLRGRILERLVERLDHGLIEEVHGLHERGVPWERLEQLGLEYRFVAEFLRGAIRSRNDLVQKLHAAICQFAKRQDTWFRRMERQGAAIHWIPEADYDAARAVVAREWHV